MKLPVNCFKTITDYAKQNWACDLAPAKERTWTQWNGLDGYKNIVKEEFGNTTRFSWKEGTSTTDWTYWLAVAMYADTDDYKGYVPVFHGKFLSYAAMTKSSWNPKDNSLKMAMAPGGTSGIYLNAILIDYINLDAYWIPNQAMLELCKAQKGKNFSWFAIGDSKQVNSSFFKYFEITMVPMERINKAPKTVIPVTLEPIKVGDTLGLVYWDGTMCSDAGGSISIKSTKTSPTGTTYCWLTARPSDAGRFSFYDAINQRETILTKAGTVNLERYNISVNSLESAGNTCLKDHLWHVI